jgi:hypothetical protein
MAAAVDSPLLPTVNRLNRASVTKRFEAHRDVAWDAAENEIEPHDPRLCLPPGHPFAQTSWYRERPAATRADLGADWICQTFRIGISFESCLSRGLLEFAGTLPNGSPMYRYAMHEVVEESHHSMMFHEFVRRAGREPHDVSALEQFLQRRVVQMGRTFPELFFLCVLSGEVFIDHDNRELLRSDADAVHPLLRRVVQIHVTEEARHVCFANAYLREHLPRAPAWKKRVIGSLAPSLLARGEELMLRPSPAIVSKHGIPRTALAQAFGPTSAYASKVREVVSPIFSLLRECGVDAVAPSRSR